MSKNLTNAFRDDIERMQRVMKEFGDHHYEFDETEQMWIDYSETRGSYWAALPETDWSLWQVIWDFEFKGTFEDLS